MKKCFSSYILLLIPLFGFSQHLIIDTLSIPLEELYVVDMKSGDLDNDGQDELIVLTEIDDEDRDLSIVLIYKWIDGAFERSNLDDGLFEEISSELFICDIDNDSYDDILVSNDGILLYLNKKGKISFKDKLVKYTCDNFILDDLDNDLKADLIFSSPAFNNVQIFQQNTSHIFYYKTEFESDNRIKFIKSFSLNKDADVDILTVEFSSGDINIFQNDKFLDFREVGNYNIGEEIISVETADFNGDGLDDFVVFDKMNNIYFFENRVDTFEIVFSDSLDSPSFLINATDINGDSLADLIVATNDGNIYLYINDGEFKFTKLSLNTSSFISSNTGLTVGDFDMDGNIDIAYGKDPIYVSFNIMKSLDVTKTNAVVNNNDVIIYPNPFRDKLHFSNLKIGSIITISSITGRRMIEYKVTSSQTDLDNLNLRKGIYFVEIFDGIKREYKKIISF